MAWDMFNWYSAVGRNEGSVMQPVGVVWFSLYDTVWWNVSLLAKLRGNLLMGVSAGLQMDFHTASAVQEMLCFQK